MSRKISHIKDELRATAIEDIDVFMDIHKTDERVGVQKLVASAARQKEVYIQELERTETMKVYENSYADKGMICGIDEVGRGPLAGPVVTAAVILPEDCSILYINDSKKLTEKKREELYARIMDQAVAVSIGVEGVDVIDEINILQATYSAMRKAVTALEVTPDLLLVDAVTIPDIDIEQVAIIKGDEKSISIAAASIIAKVTRDRMMMAYDDLFPEYGFAGNKGYGAKLHTDAIVKYGPCPIHRQSFIRNFV